DAQSGEVLRELRTAKRILLDHSGHFYAGHHQRRRQRLHRPDIIISRNGFGRAQAGIPEFCRENEIPLMSGTIRSNITVGALVEIVLKKDKQAGASTKGIVKDILTSSSSHSRGIKVRLEDGQVGHVKNVLPRKEQ